jgi:hypothetical protein
MVAAVEIAGVLADADHVDAGAFVALESPDQSNQLSPPSWWRSRDSG